MYDSVQWSRATEVFRAFDRKYPAIADAVRLNHKLRHVDSRAALARRMGGLWTGEMIELALRSLKKQMTGVLHPSQLEVIVPKHHDPARRAAVHLSKMFLTAEGEA